MKKKNRSRLDRRRLKNTNQPDRWPMNMIHMNTKTPDDRLSTLPDDVISHILSFLPTTNFSVQTSVLAKGWRRLWTRVTSLFFTIENPADLKTVNEVMLQHTGHTIHTFSLFCAAAAADPELIGSWIATVLDRSVHTLFIYLDHYHDDQFKWPPHLSASETLVDLSLTNCCHITANIRFPALKRLSLDGVRDEPLPRLLSNCPLLEELSIQMVHCHKNNIEVCSTTLTRLTIGSWDFDSTTDYSPQRVYTLKLDTPALRHLYLRSGQYEILSAGKLNYVTHANADCCVRDCVESDSDDEYYGNVEKRSKVASFRNTVLEFVGKMYNVECLTLKCPLIVPYPTFSDSAPKFRNLTELDLWGGFCFLKCFLENADSLRSLTIGGRDTGPWTEPRYWEEPKQVPTCLTSSLETVNLLDFKLVSGREFDAARYILKNGKVLKMMTISTRLTPYFHQYYNYPDNKSNKDKFEATKNEKFQALKQLALFERGSNACKLDFEILYY